MKAKNIATIVDDQFAQPFFRNSQLRYGDPF